MLARVGEGQQGAAAVITMGDVEMTVLAEAGSVDAGHVQTVARNTYRLALVAPSDSDAEGLESLTEPTIESVFVEDPSRSSLGHRAEQALRRLGLWDAVAPKVVRPNPSQNLLAQMLSGSADAAVVFRDCLFAESGSADSVPSTVRIVGEVPEGCYDPIPYKAAAIGGAELADDFVDFLVSQDGRQALRDAGLTPAQ
jgi:molybdate transport system substrate-binding protein